jgi:glucosamine-6-phosphate deaminase
LCHGKSARSANDARLGGDRIQTLRGSNNWPQSDEANPGVKVKKFTAGMLHVEIHSGRESAAQAAAMAFAGYVADAVGNASPVGVVFATGASQFALLSRITALNSIQWERIHGFHLDEYVGLPETHRASFRNYLRRHLVTHVPIGSFRELDGTAPDLDRVCAEYAHDLRTASPAVCLLGIGENGHLAFNDPGIADFNDPVDVKIAELDEICRRQQVAEGWFNSLEEVPNHAITLTIPAILRVPHLIVSVPGSRKAAIACRALTEPITNLCPATILREHPNATLYLDEESAAELGPLQN